MPRDAEVPLKLLNIIVCVKPVPDPRASAAVAVDRATGRVNRERVPLVPNRNDRVALELGLRFRSEAGDGLVTAVLMGPPAAEGVARQCLALGADEAWLVSDRALAGSDALVTAKVLARAVRRRTGSADGAPVAEAPYLVLAGVESSDGGTGQVGPTLAALLGLYHLAGVTALRPSGAGVEVAVQVAGGPDGGFVVYEAAVPILVTVARAACDPPTPTMLGIVQARSRPLLTLDCSALGLDPAEVGESGSPTKVGRLLPYEGGKTADLWKGRPEEQARALAGWLQVRGFLAGCSGRNLGGDGADG